MEGKNVDPIAAGHLNIADCLKRHTIIIGAVNSGKTRLTREVMDDLTATGHGPQIILLDLAPETTKSIGGKLPPASPDIHYLTCTIVPPRLSGKNDEEILMYARQNAQRIDALIDSAFDLIGKSAGDDPILIVNDASLYLQGNNPERLLSLVEACPTAILNAYSGHSFAPSPFTDRERQGVEALAANCDVIIRLP